MTRYEMRYRIIVNLGSHHDTGVMLKEESCSLTGTHTAFVHWILPYLGFTGNHERGWGRVGSGETGSHEWIAGGAGGWARGFFVPSLCFVGLKFFHRANKGTKTNIKKGSFVQILFKESKYFMYIPVQVLNYLHWFKLLLFLNLYFHLINTLFAFLSESHHSSAISEVIEMELPMEG